MQLAIWNIVYDTDATLSAGPGALFSDSTTYRTYANDLLSAAGSFGIDRQLYVMTSSTRQDQLFWLDAQQVPAHPPASAVAAGTHDGLDRVLQLAERPLEHAPRRRAPGRSR